MSNKMENIDLSFTLNAQAVEQSGKALRKSLESGLGAVDFSNLRRNANKTFLLMGKDLQKALGGSISLDTSQIDRQLAQLHDKRLGMERQLANEAAKGAERGSKQQTQFAKIRERLFKRFASMETKLLKQKQDGMKNLNKLAQKHIGIMKKGGGKGGMMKTMGGKGGGKAMAGQGKVMGGLVKTMGKMGKMGGMFARILPALGAMGAALGPIGAGLAALAVSIGAVVGVFMGLVSVVMAADSAAKDLNKEIVKSAAGADLVTKGYASAAKNLDVYRRASLDAQLQLGSLAKDNIAILGSLNQHGLTIREMGRDMNNASVAAQAYTDALKHVLQYSRMIGESATTVAQNMAQAGEELGLTLEGVAQRFSKITKFAMESGFSTKRFYSMVIQATAGMSMYNVRLGEASGLLVRIGKILGQKTGGEFLSSLSKGFVNESMTDRIKRVKLAGSGRTQETFDRSADNTAADFQEKLEKAVKGLKDSEGNNIQIDLGELTGGKLTGDMVRMSRDGLREELAKLNPAEQAKFLARFAAKMESVSSGEATGLRQSLSTLIEVNEGAKGGTLNMAKQLGSLDMGGKLNMLKDSMKTMFPGKEIHELSTLQLAALENATGMQGEQLHQMRKLTQGLEGNFSVLQEDARANRQLTEEEKKEQIKAYGAFVENGKVIAASLDRDGNIDRAQYRDENNNLVDLEIKDFDQYIQSQGKRLGAMEEAKNFNEDRAISQDIANNTFSIADMLKAGIANVLERIYGAVKSIVNKLFDDPNMNAALSTQAESYRKADEAVQQGQQIDREIRDKEREMQKTGDLGERERIAEEIRMLKDMKKQAAMDADIFKALGDAVFNADGTVSAKGSGQSQAAAGYKSGMDVLLGAMPFGSGTNRNINIHDAPAHMQRQFTTGAANYDVLQEIMDENPELKARLTKTHGELMGKYAAHNEGSASMTPLQNDAMLAQKKGQMEWADWLTHNTNIRRIDDTRWDDRVTHTGGTQYTAATGIRNAQGVEVSFEGAHDAFGTHRGNHGEEESVVRARGEEVDIGGRGNRGHSGSAATDPKTSGRGIVDNAIRHSGVVDFQQQLIAAHDGTAPWDTDFDISEQNYVFANRASVTNPSTANMNQLGGMDQYNATAADLNLMGIDLMQSIPTITTYNDTGEGTGQGGYTSNPGQVVKNGRFEQSISNQENAIATGGTFSSNTGDAVAFYDSLVNSGVFGGEDSTTAENVEAVNDTLKELKDEVGSGFSLKAWQDYLSQKYPKEVEKFKEIEKRNREQEVHLGKLKKLIEKFPKDMQESMSAAQKEAQDQTATENLLGMVGLSNNNAAKRQMEDGTVSRNSQLGRALAALTSPEARENDPTTAEIVSEAMARAGVRLQDFIYQGGSNGGVIRPIHGQDSLLAMGKPGGPMENAFGRGQTVQPQIVEVQTVCAMCLKKEIVAQSRQRGPGGNMKTRAGRGNFG